MNIKGRRVETAGDLKTPGDFTFQTLGYKSTTDQAIINRLNFACPNTGLPCGAILIGLKEKPSAKPSWRWDGNLDRPTLKPSINCVGGCGWHGFVIEGNFVDGEDWRKIKKKHKGQ